MELSIRRFSLPLTATLLCWALAGLVGRNIHHPRIVLPAQETNFSFDADVSLMASVGMRNAWADVFWVQTLIDSDLEHYRGVELGSWMFRRFELIARLDPLFYENYLYGGQYLMIVKDDLAGAQALLARGLEEYPDDMSLNWQMGFLLIFERGDVESGYPYFAKVHRHPKRPAMFDSIFARLSAERLGLQEAYDLTFASWSTQPEGSPLRRRLGQILHAIRADLDLRCVQATGRPCRPLDFYGQPYVLRATGWDTANTRIRLSLRLNKQGTK